MLNPFKPLELIKAEVFTSLPAQFRNRRRTAWSDPNRQGAEVECFLEGPSFDREGNLWIVDIPFGRISESPEAGVGARHAVRRLAQRTQVPQG
jgi:gluconolactonase